MTATKPKQLPKSERRAKYQYRYEAAKKPACEWIAMIQKLPKTHQAILARVVWWDWFAETLVKNRISEFDVWLNTPLCPIEEEPKVDELIASAMTLGYPQVIATQRFRVKRNFNKFHKKNETKNSN
jgi:hypothetical protein